MEPTLLGASCDELYTRVSNVVPGVEKKNANFTLYPIPLDDGVVGFNSVASKVPVMYRGKSFQEVPMLYDSWKFSTFDAAQNKVSAPTIDKNLHI